MKLHVVRANDITFTCYVHGDGPELMLLCHGFPDDAATMLRLMERLPVERFTMVAPHMRGLGPTSRAQDRRYHYADLGRDLVSLIEAFGFERAHLYGHGFGALAGYAAAQLDPAVITHLVAACVPPPMTSIKNLSRHPAQLARCWHIGLMQVPWLGKQMWSMHDEALIETLWRLWSPDWHWDADRLAKVKSSLKRRGARGAVARYYRGLVLDAVLDHTSWRASYALAKRPIEAPTTVLYGRDDGCITPEMFEHLEDAFSTSRVRSHCLEQCGHFPHHERLDAVLDVLTGDPPAG